MGVDIVGFIKKTLDEKEVSYKYYDPPVNKFSLEYVYKDKKLGMSVIPLNNNRIFLKARFPFKVESSVFVILSLFITEYNYNKAYGTLHLSPDGTITLEYTYMILSPSDCNADILNKQLYLIAHEYFEQYDRICSLCGGGGIPEKEQGFYKAIIRENLDRLWGRLPSGPKRYGSKPADESLTESDNGEHAQLSGNLKAVSILLPFEDAC